MDFLGWAFALSAMGMAGAAMSQIASLKQEVQVLKDDLRRRGLLEPTVGERKIIVPDNLHSK
jgi:hypothetical protein